MLVRSLTFASLLVVAGPLFAATPSNVDPSPLEQDLGKARPLIVIVPSTADPTLRGLQDALKDPDTKSKFAERNLVLYSVAGTIGKRDDKFLEQKDTMILIRQLSKAAEKADTRVFLVGKDGEARRIESDGPVSFKQIFDAVDQLPAEEKAIQPPTVASQAASQAGAEEKPAKDGKPAKPVKPAKPLPPPKPLED
ncbi:DUF4174 domain-containing protein [Pseudomonas fontis]|uniref:DUF4174 domain-containing protein n=1 Tax=Pseudomonas fontis TaxID=2942633 RepID=A0ABT5NMH1_9PSED|nr:DUF4174 domain-containing protein [Pseudomonas fontis]MDD0976640.1 DUF4174 domain-containing protein [Pseudomonas fontis]MDD0988988.1 DUF4174 domain-containing protein [Pseudomonas fontis]